MTMDYQTRLERYRRLIAIGDFRAAGAEWRELSLLVKTGQLAVVSHDEVFFPTGSKEFAEGLAEYERRFTNSDAERKAAEARVEAEIRAAECLRAMAAERQGRVDNCENRHKQPPPKNGNGHSAAAATAEVQR